MVHVKVGYQVNCGDRRRQRNKGKCGKAASIWRGQCVYVYMSMKKVLGASVQTATLDAVADCIAANKAKLCKLIQTHCAGTFPYTEAFHPDSIQD